MGNRMVRSERRGASAACEAFFFAKAVFGTIGGADPLVRAGPPGPALLSKNQASAALGKPARGPAADRGVRPTTAENNSRESILNFRQEVLRKNLGVLLHLGARSRENKAIAQFVLTFLRFFSVPLCLCGERIAH